MDFNEYQKCAAATALYPDKGGLGGLSYCALGLTGEAGEFANKVKKLIRGDVSVPLAERDAKLVDELGDVLWYIAECAANLGVDLEVVAQRNLEKLAARKTAGTVRGEGDDR